MSKKALLKAISVVTAISLSATLLIGCGANKKANETTNQGGQPSTTAAATTAPAEKSKVDFWYLWGGAESQRVENFIKSFNDSQNKYEVKGLYIADMQKVKVAIAGGTGPDITDDFDGNIASYAEEGIMEPLDEYIKKDNLNFDDYVSGSLDMWKYNDKVYALPAGLNYFMMYYNKTLLKNAGFNEPPKTQEELMDMAVKTTVVNTDKSIKVMGFPEFPAVYYLSNMVFASGGSYYKDGVFTPDNPEMISALNFIRSYREKFGVDNVLKFNQSGKYNEATDPFMTGNQTFRFDGLWLASSIRNDLKIGQDKLDYGIAPIPYPKNKPDAANSAQLTSSIFYIPSNAKNKDGAWELMKYINTGVFNKYMNSLPILKSQMDAEEFKSIIGIKEYGDFAKVAKFSYNPPDSKYAELSKMLNDEAELAMTLKKTPEEAMKTATEKAKSIIGK
jgi:Maltose-binding periplasmic proteins/domains